MSRGFLVAFFALAILALASFQVSAQTTYGTISGMVKDESGGVTPGVTITVVNIETDLRRTTVTDDAGRYSVPQLPLGQYQVTAELSGFQRTVRTGITLTVGREAVVDLSMKVGEITTQVEVSGEAPLVNTRSSTLTGLVEEAQVRELPLNARDYMQLAQNQQGVLFYRSSAPSGSTGIGTRVSVGGARDNQNSFLMDGTDINDYSNSTPAGAAGAALGVETIREFQILTNAYSAEFGRNAGGVINLVTRSGTNDFHGTLYHFIRNDVMDARNFFAPLTQRKPPYRRNQFGAMATGPIHKGSTFFMGNYEGLRERLGRSFVSRVPTAEGRQGILGTRTVRVSDVVKPYLALYPLPSPTGRQFGDGTAEYLSSYSRATDQDFLVGRIDHTFSEKDTVFGRYTWDDSVRVSPDAFNQFSSDFSVRNQYLTLEHQHIFSPRLLNTARFGFSRSFNNEFPRELTAVNPALSFVPGKLFGDISVTNLAGVGTGTLVPRYMAYNTYDLQDHVARTTGRHSAKFGVNIKHFQDNHRFENRERGSYSFLGLQQFLEGTANTITVGLPGSDGQRGIRTSLFGFYVQDDWQVSPRLTLNQGLRYEFITVPTEVNGKLSNLRNVMDPEATLGPYFRNPSLKNFAPRVGMAWDPFGNGKTAVRLGAGVFFDQVLSTYYGAGVTAQQPPFFRLALATNPPFPNFYQSVTGANAEPRNARRALAIDYYIKTPRRVQFNLNVQHQLAGGIVVNVGYVGSQSRHQISLVNEHNTAIPQILPDGRKFFPAGSPRRNPNWGNINFRKGGFNGFYNALQAGVNKRFGGGTLLQFSYTFSKNITDGDTTIATTTDPNGIELRDPDNRERALSQYDIRHNAVTNFVMELPYGSGRKWGSNAGGLAQAILGGWDASGIVTLSSGNPTTITIAYDAARQQVRSGGGGQRPDQKPDCSNNPVLGGPDRYFDSGCFTPPTAGFYGTLGRQTLIAPGLVTIDGALRKKFVFRESRILQFRAEFFNLSNRANFGLPDTTVFRAGGVSNNGAGRISSTVTSARQIQFGLKFMF